MMPLAIAVLYASAISASRVSRSVRFFLIHRRELGADRIHFDFAPIGLDDRESGVRRPGSGADLWFA